jgi:Domain of unknown function (DUF305)
VPPRLFVRVKFNSPAGDKDDPDVASYWNMVENQAAMSKMMKDMRVKPSGNVDADFTAMMIPHHQGAVEMAKAELHYGLNRKLRRIARNIIAGQTQQIGMMKAALGQPLSHVVPSATQSAHTAQAGGGSERYPAR